MADKNDGTSQGLTVESAAEALKGLLSATPEEKPSREAPRVPVQDPTEGDTTVDRERDDDEELDEDDREETEQSRESDEDDDAEEVPQTPKPRTFKVKVDGEELEVPEDELVKGYSRTADYTRKTQAVAEKDKSLEAERQSLAQTAQRYAASLAQIEEHLKAAGSAEPDWDTLRQGDPAEFAATWATWDQHTKRLAAVAAERAKADAKVRDDQTRAYDAHLAAEHAKLLDVLPAWKDAAVAAKEQAELVAYARDMGYADDEVSKVTDHRLLLVLRDAAHGRTARKGAPGVLEKIEKAKDATPGPSAATRRQVPETTRRLQALAKSGSVDDAAAAIRTLL